MSVFHLGEKTWPSGHVASEFLAGGTVNFPVALGDDVGVHSKKRAGTGTARPGRALQRSLSGSQHPQ